MSSLPVGAVNTHDDADLVQWLLASELAQDVVFQSLITAMPPDNSSPNKAVTSNNIKNGRALPGDDLISPSAPDRFISSVTPDLKVVSKAPLRISIPVELLEEEKSERFAIQTEFETSVALFRHMHPAYLHVAYDWTLGGPRLSLARDRQMFHRDAERHLPRYMQKEQAAAGKKPKDFFSRELGHVMEVKGQLAQAYTAQQLMEHSNAASNANSKTTTTARVEGHSSSAALATAASDVEPAADAVCEDDAGFQSAQRRRQLEKQTAEKAKIIATQSFIVVPVGITSMRIGSASSSRGAATQASSAEQRRNAPTSSSGAHDEPPVQDELHTVPLRDQFAQTLLLRETMTRDTLAQSEAFQRLQLLHLEQNQSIAARVRGTHRHQECSAVEAAEPTRVEFSWNSTSMVTRNVAPPKSQREDAQRHLPVQFRRPGSAGTSSAAAAPRSPDKPLGLRAGEPATTTAQLAVAGNRAFASRVQSAGCARPPPAAVASTAVAAASSARGLSSSAASPPEAQTASTKTEGLPAVLAKSSLALRVSSAPVRRVVPQWTA
jgi:hypothetical protein